MGLESRFSATATSMRAILQAERAVAQARVERLETALMSARTIGVAVGIIMTVRRIDQDDAYALLTRMSQHGNRKLLAVADDVVYTGLITGPPDPAE